MAYTVQAQEGKKVSRATSIGRRGTWPGSVLLGEEVQKLPQGESICLNFVLFNLIFLKQVEWSRTAQDLWCAGGATIPLAELVFEREGGGCWQGERLTLTW